MNRTTFVITSALLLLQGALPSGRSWSALDGLPSADSPVALGKQLLENPGCEKQARQGKIPGWVVRKGKWAPRHKKGGAHPGPKKGRFYFAPSSKTKLAVLYQQVDLSKRAKEIAAGELEVVVKGSVASYRQKGGDRSQVRLEFVTPDGTVSGVASKSIYSPEWKSIELSQIIPEDATSVRVVLVAKRVKGSCRQSNNDGCFDDLSLRLRKKSD